MKTDKSKSNSRNTKKWDEWEVRPQKRRNRARSKTCGRKSKGKNRESVRARSSKKEKEREPLAEAQGVSCYPRMLCSNLLWYFCFCLCLCSALSGLANWYTVHQHKFCICERSWIPFLLKIILIGICMCLSACWGPACLQAFDYWRATICALSMNVTQRLFFYM